MEETYKRLGLGAVSIAQRLVRLLLLLPAFAVFMSRPALALSIISDEETEQLLGEIAKPLFDAANIKFDRNKLFIVNDQTLNAFVSDGNNLFVNTGTILNADTPNELAGVIAHETGHIKGGHILRQKLKNREMQKVIMASTLLAGAAAVGGKGDAAVAVLMGSQSSALTHYTRYRTEEERAADNTAISLLKKTQQSSEGMLAFMRRIAQKNTLNGIEESPYFRTHPVTRERINFFEKETTTAARPYDGKLQPQFDRVKAKLFAYLRSPAETLRKYPLSDKSVAADYARAIAYFKQNKFAEAKKAISGLVQTEPSNPYFYELRGQINLETGSTKEAEYDYRKALNAMPSSSLLQLSLAQAILENAPSSEKLQEAINLLNKSLITTPSGFGWLLISRAYGLQGLEAEAQYAAAEYSLHTGAYETAKRQALSAKKNKPSAQILQRTNDLLSRLQDIEKNKDD